MTGRLTGRGVLIWLFGFFAVIFAMNIYFIMVSSRTFRGEDEQKPYLQGVEFNQTLARRAEQESLGWV
ncbi:MAG TPA: FixH family protein, partial [Rhizomicrobium sp.]